MNRRRIALRLSVIVALAGLVPIAVVGVAGIELLRRRTERAALASLQEVATQTAERIDGYLFHQQELVRAAAALAVNPGADRRLQELVLDAPSLGTVRLIGPDAPGVAGPASLGPEALARALKGEEVSSDVYLGPRSTPAMDLCVPARAIPSHAVCAQLELLELWRFVQRIRVGDGGYALAFNERGRLIASGAGALRSAILSGEPIPQSALAVRAAEASAASLPDRYVSANDAAVLAAWARLPNRPWSVALELPAAEVAQTARAAQWLLGTVLLLTLLLSIAIGAFQSQRVLGELQAEERWRTAGRIAAGVTHDLGHRLRILQQTAGLAEAGEPAFLPQIADNLRSEVRTLQKFITDFSDLSREVRAVEAFPLELGAFVESLRRAAGAHAEAAGVVLELRRPERPVWVAADRYLLERAVLNLISNAIEASPRGAQVQVAAGSSGPSPFLEVVDRGPGIAADRLANLFDAFVSTKRTGAHLGMGLANVKRIVDAHGGQVAVESQPGAGARFRISLPAAAEPNPQASASSSSSPGASS